MKPANLLLAALCVMLSGVGVFSQQPPAEEDGPVRHGPPPHEQLDSVPGLSGEPGDPGRDERRGWHDRDRPLSEDEVRVAIDILRRIDPAKADRLEQAFNEAPDRIGRILRERAPYLGRFMAWRRFDPQGFEMRIRDMELSRLVRDSARRLREAIRVGDDAIAATEQALLRDLVADHFDVRQTIREHELNMLKQRIEQLAEQLQRRAEQRQELIDQRVDELIDEKPADRW